MKNRRSNKIKTRTLNTIEVLEVRSEWYKRIAEKIQPLSASLGKNTYRKYKLDLFLRIARRIDMFSDLCEECQSSKEVISDLAGDIINIIQMSDREGSKFHVKTIDDITKHLQKKHKLVTKGQYVGLMSSIGIAIGMGAGFATDNAGIGTVIGTVACFLIGLYLDYKAKKEDRVI